MKSNYFDRQMKDSIKIVSLFLFTLTINSCIGQNTKPMNKESKSFSVQKTEEEWKAQLSPQEYRILREKGTEQPFSGKFNAHFEKGVYTCKACGEKLFESSSKFDSHCGWPSFDKEIEEGKIIEIPDYSFGMKRVEILCGKCGAHLGHIFKDGPTKTGLRYCVNSVSLDFEKEENTK